MTFLLLTLLVFSMPWEKSVLVPGVGTLTRLIGIGAVVSGLIEVVRARDLRRPNLAIGAAVTFILWSGATWMWSLDRSASVTRIVTYAQLLIMLLLVWQFCRDAKEHSILLASYVAGSVAAALATIVRYSAGTQTYWQRYAAPGFDPNDLGVTIAIAVPMALYLAGRATNWTAWLYRAAIVLISAAVLLTASRTALLATLAGFAFVVLTWRRSAHAQRWSGVALGILTVLGAVSLAPKESRTRIATTTSEITQGTLHKRTTIWKAGLRSLKQFPLRGAGAGAYPDAVQPYIGVPPRAGHEYVAHNTFLSVLVETGLIGFALWTIMAVVLAIFIWVLPGREAALWSTAVAVWAIGASTLTWEHRKPTWLIAALIMTEWVRAFQPGTSD